jgi:hypothetical protein
MSEEDGYAQAAQMLICFISSASVQKNTDSDDRRHSIVITWHLSNAALAFPVFLVGYLVYALDRRPVWFATTRAGAKFAAVTLRYGDAFGEGQVRQSVSLPANVAAQVRNLARRRKLSSNRMLVELIENGIEGEKRKQQEFFRLAERFRNATEPAEAKRLGDELGRMVFGD